MRRNSFQVTDNSPITVRGKDSSPYGRQLLQTEVKGQSQFYSVGQNGAPGREASKKFQRRVNGNKVQSASLSRGAVVGVGGGDQIQRPSCALQEP